MYKKLFSLILASSIVAQPMIAQETENTQERNAQSAAYKKGIITGAAASLAASCYLFGQYIATTAQNGVYIPKWILKPAGTKQTYIPKPWSDGSYHSSQLQMVSMPQYSKEKNPLYDWFLGQKGISQEQFSMLTPNLTNTIAIASLATAVGAFIYWIYNAQPTSAENAHYLSAENAAQHITFKQ